MPDDPELLQQIGRGNHAAFRTLLDRHASYLFGVAHALAGRNVADAEDLVQETLVAAIDAARSFRGESNVRTWLVRILVNRASMSRRSRSRREQPEEALVAGQRPAGPPSDSADAKLDLSAMLETLSPEHRQVIVLRELQGLSYDEMAQALSVPRGTVESRLSRARAEFREKLTRGEEDSGRRRSSSS